MDPRLSKKGNENRAANLTREKNRYGRRDRSMDSSQMDVQWGRVDPALGSSRVNSGFGRSHLAVDLFHDSGRCDRVNVLIGSYDISKILIDL